MDREIHRVEHSKIRNGKQNETRLKWGKHLKWASWPSLTLIKHFRNIIHVFKINGSIGKYPSLILSTNKTTLEYKWGTTLTSWANFWSCLSTLKEEMNPDFKTFEQEWR